MKIDGSKIIFVLGAYAIDWKPPGRGGAPGVGDPVRQRMRRGRSSRER